jgi:HD-GYP domain-containing protein (c-di-GMP phosphodiesterase class II)
MDFFPGTVKGINLGKLLAPAISPEETGNLLRELRSVENHYHAKRQLYIPSRDKLPMELNLLFSPYLEEEASSAPPDYWLLFVDDVSLEHRKLLRGTFLSLLEASKLKDNDTGNHITRVGEYAKLFAESLAEDPEFKDEITYGFIDDIHFLAPMHDVGKIGTPDDILNKEGPLDSREWEIMKEHTINGAFILNSYPADMAKQIALHHHERWDGNGYPYALSGEMIPLSSRIVSICDVYDALRMKRSYKEPIPHEESCSIILQGRGTQFDPRIVSHFDNIKGIFEEIHRRLYDDFV